jgi:hypothetical protein
MGLPKNHWYIGNLWIVDKCNGALIIQTQKPVPGVWYTMHPVQGLQFHAQFVGEELNLYLHVGRADGQVMQSGNPVSGSPVHRFTPC